MEKSSILYILKSNGVNGEHLEMFKEKLKKKDFNLDDCDKLLEKLGYEKVFTVNEDDMDDEFDDYDEFEPNGHKKHFEDELDY